MSPRSEHTGWLYRAARRAMCAILWKWVPCAGLYRPGLWRPGEEVVWPGLLGLLPAGLLRPELQLWEQPRSSSSAVNFPLSAGLGQLQKPKRDLLPHKGTSTEMYRFKNRTRTQEWHPSYREEVLLHLKPEGLSHNTHVTTATNPGCCHLWCSLPGASLAYFSTQQTSAFVTTPIWTYIPVLGNCTG